ncbi:MAG: N-acetylmuramoyl-L-alanine amidase [Firmicutes bacterium]|nr:N-acetylmuramoyl-L-alanine amidase [Bacillota bacterium]
MLRSMRVRKAVDLFPLFFCCALLLIFIAMAAGAAFPAEAAGGEDPVNIKVEAAALHFRSGPALSHDHLQTLPRGMPLQVLLHENEGWLLVRLKDGRTGWVIGQHTGFSPTMADKLPPVIGEEARVRVNQGPLNVRLGPGLNFQIIKQLSKNTAFTVCFHEGSWLLARFADGSSGWVHIDYTTYNPQGPGSDNPAGDSPEGPEDPEKKSDSSPEQTAEAGMALDTDNEEKTREPYQVSISEDSLRLREEPCLTGKPLIILSRGTILTVRDKTEDNWLQVSTSDGKHGWVAGWCTQLHAGEEWSLNPAADGAFRLAIINTDVLRVRSGPGLQHAQTGKVYLGDHILVLKEENGWYHIHLPGDSYGWICGDYATIKNIASRGGKPLVETITIVLDPGHGGQDCGAIGCTGLKEKGVNLAVALHTANLLRNKGFNVTMTRNEDKSVALAERVAIAERTGAALFVSIHANSSAGNKNASGTETYYCPGKNISPQSAYLASLVQRELCSALNLPDRGVKKDSFHVLRETCMPAVLVELAFLSNAADENILRSEECLQKAAEALYRAVLGYYNLRR